MKKIILFLLFFVGFKSSRAQQKSTTGFNLNDSSKIIVTNKDSILKYDIGSDWSLGIRNSPFTKLTTITSISIDSANPPLYLLNGKKITRDEMNKIDHNTIKSINVLKDKAATLKYGDEGKNGVILINLKPVNP